MSELRSAALHIAGSQVDWADVHRRLHSVHAALDGTREPSPEETRRTLKLRAQALAREGVPEGQHEQRCEVVEFLLFRERYGVETSHVREVYPLKDFTPLPGTPPFIFGVANVRGRILTIVDMKTLFELPQQGLTDRNRLLILSDGKIELALLVDTVCGVRLVAERDIQPALPTLTEIREEFLRGITGERLIVLDGRRILEHPGISTNE